MLLMSLFPFLLQSIVIIKMINVVLEFLRDVPKKISDQENDFDKITVFKIFCNDNIVIFSAIENSFSKKKITVIRYSNSWRWRLNQEELPATFRSF